MAFNQRREWLIVKGIILIAAAKEYIFHVLKTAVEMESVIPPLASVNATLPLGSSIPPLVVLQRVEGVLGIALEMECVWMATVNV